MDYIQQPSYSSTQSIGVLQHRVLRNTYFLLSLTLLFSAVCAAGSMVLQLPYPGPLLTMVGMFGLLFLTQALRNSVWGLVAIFLFTGFTGYSLGPVLNLFMYQVVNGQQILLTALGGTGAIFTGLSAYTLVSRKDFSFLGGILFVGILSLLIVSLIGMFFQTPILQLGLSAAGILIASGYILYDTSRIIHDGETNYIMATIQLYLDFYMLFINLLNLLGIMNQRD